ncbi:hypothetical protein [Crocosphaera sp.]|uniref:hypothetical protein n=1 Tax=Crocosphaera sp. TaxID=2729996 RepID=UPI00257BF63F|nr:hypothetical protein [Crocosphaera sp.]NQZ65435.1 hypothetical protein [Crocosphaera sp.]
MSKQIFKDIDSKLKSDIRKGFTQNNINASGNASKSLRSEITNTKYTLFGASYIEESEKGRGRNQSNTGGLFQGIYQWLQFKKYGITYSDDKEKRSIAFAIMKKTAKSGSFKFRNTSKRTNVIETAIEDTTKTLRQKLIIFVRESELKQLRELFN